MIRSRIGWRRVGFLAGDRDAEKPKDNTPASLASLALPGLAWVQIESATVEVEGRLEILDIAEAAGYALNLLNLAVESFAHRVGHRMLVGGQDVVDVPANRLGRLANRRQLTVRRPEVPQFPELPACCGVDILPQATQGLFDGPGPPDVQLLVSQHLERVTPPLRHVRLGSRAAKHVGDPLQHMPLPFCDLGGMHAKLFR